MTQLLASSAFPAPEHDHGHCLAEAMDRARKAFEDKGLKLTGLRRSVFGEIAASHKAIGAYEVLAELAARGERLAPISVYRAIDALVAVGIVHRFESRNAFLPAMPATPRAGSWCLPVDLPLGGGNRWRWRLPSDRHSRRRGGL